MWFMSYYILNLLRPYLARPNKPETSSIIVTSSGFAIVASMVEAPSVEAIEVEVVEVEIDLGVELSVDFSGQPTISKNIIMTYKIINSFYILFPL
jgi:hypothetical protein